MVELNKRFGFRVIRRRKAIYYQDPEEPTVVMELKLPPDVNSRLVRDHTRKRHSR